MTTTERIGLAYNQLGVNVTVANPSGMTAVKVVMSDAQGASVATRQAELSGGSASVDFTGLVRRAKLG